MWLLLLLLLLLRWITVAHSAEIKPRRRARLEVPVSLLSTPALNRVFVWEDPHVNYPIGPTHPNAVHERHPGLFFLHRDQMTICTAASLLQQLLLLLITPKVKGRKVRERHG